MTVFREPPKSDFSPALATWGNSGRYQMTTIDIRPWPTRSECERIVKWLRETLEQSAAPDLMTDADLYGEPEPAEPARMHPDDLTA